MVRNGLSVSLCAGMLLALISGAGSVRGEDAESKIRRQLAVQSALQQGRDNLQRGEFQAAVSSLEKEIARVDGNRDYMNALRDAYRGYIRELLQSNRHTEARTYQERLKILDPGYQIELNDGRSSTPPTIASLAAQSAPPPPPTTKPSVSYTARPQMPDEHPDPFADSNSAPTASNREVLERARREYDAKNFASANRLYEEANRVDSQATTPYREFWAYCKLYVANEALNKAGWVPPTEAEKEVLAAMNLSTSPELQRQGKQMLRVIGDRRIEVRHVPAEGQKWPEVETANFRVVYYECRDLAEQTARVAELTRAAAIRKWFGEEPTPWETKCIIFLYPNGDFYARQTGEKKDSPGHSTLRRDPANLERVVKRQIDLHCDVADMLTHVLPHETTHVVLFNRFGQHLLPRWADEGMAILSEPREKIERYLKMIPSLRERHELFSASELMALGDNYPDVRRITPFYVQSIALVDYLTSQKGGTQEFTRFVCEGLESGFERSLQRHYGFRDFRDLEEHWSQSAGGVALSGR